MSGNSPAETVPPGVDSSVPNSARVWNYWLGGKDNYAADRETGDHVLAALPIMGTIAREDRAFLGRAVRYVTGQGIRQFLDIGTGIPTADNTHQVAQGLAAESRIVYVDNDRVVLAHARALLTSTPPGSTVFIDADLRDPDGILAAAAQTLDFGQPVAVMLLAILGHLGEDDDPHAVVARLMDAVPSGSYLVVSHPIDTSAEMNEAARVWNEASPVKIWPRSRAEIARFFTGLELLEPGVVSLPEWRPDGPGADGEPGVMVPHFCGVGRKP